MFVEIVPLYQRAARQWVAATHRHLPAPVGDLFRNALMVDGALCSVAMAGRPCRMLDDGRTVEITRVSSISAPGANACSRLYGALVRAGLSLGYKRFVTYTLPSEPGTSLRAANFVDDGLTDGGEWSRPSRKRKAAAQSCKKRRWIYPARCSGLWNGLKPGIVAVLLLLALTVAASAQIARRQADVYVTAINYGTTLSFPTAPQPHDLLFLAVSTYSGATVAPTGSGWTLLLHQSANNWQQLVYWHAVAAGEANSYPVTNDNQSELKMMDLEGTAFYGPIDAVVSAAPASSGASYTTPAATGTVTGDLPIAVLSTDDVTGASVASPWTGAFSAQPHPLSLAIGPLTTDTTTAQSATFTLSAASTGGFGAATILVKPYNTAPIAPVADSGSGYSGILPNTIAFDASASSDPKQETLAYAWTFGDGATGTGVNPSHSYAAIGRYTATVTVTNTDGLSSSASTTVVIQVSPTVATLGLNGALNGFSPSPADLWHQRVDTLPVDPNSAALIAAEGRSGLHVDGGSGEYGAYGIAYTVVDSTTQPFVPWDHNPVPGAENYLYFSDLTRYPIPLDAPIEGNPPDCETSIGGDNHVLVFDRATGLDSELWQARRCPAETPVWSADAGAYWDGKASNQQRAYTLTSADAGGLSVFSGLIRLDEILSVLNSAACRNDVSQCFVPHAFRMEFKHQLCDNFGPGNSAYGAFALPAVHSTCNGGNFAANGVTGNLYGDRWRLKASFDLSGYSPIAQVILRTAQIMGWINADIGSDFYFQTTADANWNDDRDLIPINSIPRSALELVQRKPQLAMDRYPEGASPVINSFTASPSTITAGGCVTLAWSTTGALRAYIDGVGPLASTSGSQQFCPTSTAQLTLTASNLFLSNDDGYGDGHRPVAFADVTVQPATTPKPPFFWGR